jgi:hypothetical protein
MATQPATHHGPIRVDPDRLRKYAANLISYAAECRRHAPHTREITVSAGYFPAAKDLEGRIVEVGNSIAQNMAMLADVLDKVAGNLKAVARTHENSADLLSVRASELEATMDAVASLGGGK